MLRIALRATIITLMVCIGAYVFIGALQEKPPEHPLDFQDITERPVNKPLNSVEDGLPYAINRAHEWRKDAVLTDIEIISVGKNEIEGNKGKANYWFQLPCVNESNPGGIIIISVNLNSNIIELVEAYHDDDYYKTKKIKELKLKNLAFADIKQLYDTAINEIGKDNIFQYQQPFARMQINSDYAVFNVSPSMEKQYPIKYSVKIDVKTGKVLGKEA